MTTKNTPPRSTLLLVIVALLFGCLIPGVHSQHGQAPLQELGDVLLQVFDTSHDQKVSLTEVEGQLQTLQVMMGGAGDGDAESQEYFQILKAFSDMSTQVFDLLDVNQDKFLTKREFDVVTKLHKSLLKNGEFRPMLRDLFGILDTNDNDELSMDEWLFAMKDAATLSAITERVHKLFPLRKKAEDLEQALHSIFWGIVGNNKEGLDEKLEAAARQVFDSLDAESDGVLQRADIGKAYTKYGKKFLEIAKTIRQMGPMLAMMGTGSADRFKTEF